MFVTTETGFHEHVHPRKLASGLRAAPATQPADSKHQRGTRKPGRLTVRLRWVCTGQRPSGERGGAETPRTQPNSLAGVVLWEDTLNSGQNRDHRNTCAHVRRTNNRREAANVGRQGGNQARRVPLWADSSLDPYLTSRTSPRAQRAMTDAWNAQVWRANVKTFM